MHPEDRLLAATWKDASHIEVSGFSVGFLSQAAAADLLPRIRDALAVVYQCDAASFGEIREAMPRILVAGASGYLAKFSRPLALCELRAEYVAHASTTQETLALTLVHEGLHARVYVRRLSARGLTRLREERFATRAENTFARRCRTPIS